MIWLYVTLCFLVLAGMLLLGIALLARRTSQLDAEVADLARRVSLLEVEKELDDEVIVTQELSRRLMEAYRRRPIRES